MRAIYGLHTMLDGVGVERDLRERHRRRIAFQMQLFYFSFLFMKQSILKTYSHY